MLKRVVRVLLFLLICSSMLQAAPARAEDTKLGPVLSILLCDEVEDEHRGKGETPLCSSRVTGSGATSLGGPFAFYDITVKVDDGHETYLTSLPGQRYTGEDYGYKFSFVPAEGVKYEFQTQASDPRGITGEVSSFSEPFLLPKDSLPSDPEAPFQSPSVPIADPGPNQIVVVNSQVLLDGSGSYDGITGTAEGLMYDWEFHFSTEPLVLDNADTANPSFTPTAEGSYLIRLQVSKAEDAETARQYSAIRYVRVIAVEELDTSVVVDTGSPTQVALGERVVLNGGGSRPSVESGAIYRWDLINRDSLDTLVAVQNSTAPVATFIPDKTGAHMFRLSVYNGEDFDYMDLLVSVYDRGLVGDLIEQQLSVQCGFNCNLADLDMDTSVTKADWLLFQEAMGSGAGESNYTTSADLNRDNLVNELDEVVFAECLATELSGTGATVSVGGERE